VLRFASLLVRSDSANFPLPNLTRDLREHAVGRGVGQQNAPAVHDIDTIWPSVFVPASGGMTSLTRCTRRLPLVKVPLFSKNDAPGSTTLANFAVSLMKNSCTTRTPASSAPSSRARVWIGLHKDPALRYWRDKQGHEVDLIWAPRGKAPLAIECKWSARDFNPANLLVFARAYPKATLLVTAPDARPAFTRKYSGIEVRFLTLDRLVALLADGSR